MIDTARIPISPPSHPSCRPAPGACDAHAHMVAGPHEYPLWPGRIENPAPGTFDGWLKMYRLQLDTLGLTRGILVQSILYGDDNRLIGEAIRRLGPDDFRGIAVVTDDADDTTLNALAEGGFKGIRLNYVHGGRLTWRGAVAMADRLRDRGMHIQALVHAGEHMAEIAGDVRRLPVPVVFDHIAWPNLTHGADAAGFTLLRHLLAEGHAWVKLSGVFRLCQAPYEATDSFVAALADANPERCLWGSDWPHLMLGEAKTPDSGMLFDCFLRAVSTDERRNRILVDNPATLYGFSDRT